MNFKLIAIDMDGTLLNSQDKISERNRKALLKAVNRGIHVVLSTGRIYKSALYYYKHIGLKSPIIACNGAIISSSEGDIISENVLDIKSIKDIIQLAEESHMYYHFYDLDKFYYKTTKEEFSNYYGYYEKNYINQDIELVPFKNPMEVLDLNSSKYHKVVFIDDNLDRLFGFREKLKSIRGIDTSKSWHNNLEVMNENVSKGNAIKYLMDVLNIDSSKVIAIGDNENDVSMFKVAGLSVAMKNGDQVAKNQADVITDTNDEDGVAKAIEKYVFRY
ncbi:MAG: HAD family phosphatase [Tissierellia bacterium]|nr:HAD family phosphatase [Tissierellia bacterium]